MIQPLVISAKDGLLASHVKYVCLQRHSDWFWDKKTATVENEKLRNLHRGKIDLPCGLGSSRALESFLLAELLRLRLGIVSMQARWGLCAPFWRTQICRKCWNWSCLGAKCEKKVKYMKTRDCEVERSRFIWGIFFPILCITVLILFLWAGVNERRSFCPGLCLRAHHLFCIICKTPWHTLTTAACFSFWEHGQTVVRG